MTYGLLRALRWVFGTALAWCLFVILCGLLSGCAAAPVVPPPVVVQGCRLKKQPPVPPRIVFATCPPYAACLTAPDAKALLYWKNEMDAWADRTWDLCHEGPFNP